MTKVTITLRDEDQRFIESAMKTGRYVTESEAVADAISELRAREEQHQARFAELRAKVMAGVEQLDRGEGSEWNVAGAKAKGRVKLSSQRASACISQSAKVRQTPPLIQIGERLIFFPWRIFL